MGQLQIQKHIEGGSNFNKNQYCESLDREIGKLDYILAIYSAENRRRALANSTKPLFTPAEIKELVDEVAIVYPPMRVISTGLTVGEITYDVFMKQDVSSLTKEVAVRTIAYAVEKKVPAIRALPEAERATALEGIKYLAGKFYDAKVGS